MSPAKLAQMASKPKVPVSPAAWLDKMATEAGHQHIRRLAELRADLQLQGTKRDFAPLAAGLAEVAEALPRLDFGLLQQKAGFLARLSGKNKTAIAEFASQYDHIEEALEQHATQAKALQGKQGDQATRNDMSLLEFEVEFRALEKIIDQGARWLQDMRAQLKEREAKGGDDEAMRQIKEDAQRCELLVGRLKMLRALSTAAHQCYEQAQATATRRAGLVQGLQAQVSARVKEWRARVAPLASAAREGEAPGLALEGPMDCHRDLQLCIKQAAADCAQMQEHEKALAESLEALGPHLQAAG
ncbi:toxic anion resistance protein [Ramlibacter sp. PS4R-6]|uniref:toxic anion resistance protein n=1 Tax=Ramlibacter sp. PS4R-6 TaxID=3133438 RepID=UPI0030A751A5